MPWFFASGTAAALASIALGGASAMVVGSLLGWLGSGNIVASAARQLVVLALAATATWGAGRLFKVTVP